MLWRMRATVRGRVQGVGFRFFVVDRARVLGEVTGFVRNAWDGRTVECEAEGPRDRLEALVEALREGPPLARVESVEVSWEETDRRRYDEFTVVH